MQRMRLTTTDGEHSSSPSSTAQQIDSAESSGCQMYINKFHQLHQQYDSHVKANCHVGNVTEHASNKRRTSAERDVKYGSSQKLESRTDRNDTDRSSCAYTQTRGSYLAADTKEAEEALLPEQSSCLETVSHILKSVAHVAHEACADDALFVFGELLLDPLFYKLHDHLDRLKRLSRDAGQDVTQEENFSGRGGPNPEKVDKESEAVIVGQRAENIGDESIETLEKQLHETLVLLYLFCYGSVRDLATLEEGGVFDFLVKIEAGELDRLLEIHGHRASRTLSAEEKLNAVVLTDRQMRKLQMLTVVDLAAASTKLSFAQIYSAVKLEKDQTEGGERPTNTYETSLEGLRRGDTVKTQAGFEAEACETEGLEYVDTYVCGLILDCMRHQLIQGAIDERNRCVVIFGCLGRDVTDNVLMTDVLTQLQKAVEKSKDTICSLQNEIRRVAEEGVRDKCFPKHALSGA